MAGNAPYDSRDLFFSVVDSDGSSTRDLSPFITAVDGLPGTRELLDTSKVGDSGHTFTPSLWNSAFRLEAWYDKTATSGIAVVVENLLQMDTATTFIYGPTGVSSGQTPVNRQTSGSCWIRTVNETGRVGNAVSMTIEGQVEGRVTLGTST